MAVRRGEVWRTTVDNEWPIVLLSGQDSKNSENGGELRAVQIVAPATAAQKQGFVVLSADVAADPRLRAEAIAAATHPIGGVGIEVPFGADEGLPRPGVVRVALPQDDRIFCTWQLSVTPENLVEHLGTLSPAKMSELRTAVRLSGIE